MFGNRDLVMGNCWVVFFLSKNSFFHPFARSCLVEKGSLWWPKVVLTQWNIFWCSVWEKILNLHRSLQSWPAYLLFPHCTLLQNASLVIAHKKKFALWYPIPPNLPLTCSTIAYFTPLMEHNSIPSLFFLSPTLPPFFSKFLLLWVLNTLLCRWHFSCSSLLFLQWKLQWKLWEMAMLHLVH